MGVTNESGNKKLAQMHEGVEPMKRNFGKQLV